MTWLKLKVKEWGWKIALITVMTALVGYYLYRLLKPAAPISPQVDKIVTQLEESKNIEDRKARLERLIQIKKELSP